MWYDGEQKPSTLVQSNSPSEESVMKDTYLLSLYTYQLVSEMKVLGRLLPFIKPIQSPKLSPHPTVAWRGKDISNLYLEDRL
jgi:hypothetical protein